MRKIIFLLSVTFTILLSGCDSTSVEITIDFDSMGGTEVITQTLPKSSTIPIPSISREGYTLDGWYTSLNNGETLDEKWSFTSNEVSNDITLYAKWVVNEYSLTIIDYDGNVILDQTVDFNSDLDSILNSVNPIRLGYIFSGWDITVPELMPANDLIINAIYVTSTYTLTFYDYDGTVLQSSVFDYETSLADISAPEPVLREGYTFNSWDIDVPDLMPSNDLEITATYSANIYTITYLDHDETVIQTVDYAYNTNLSKIKPIIPSREGYTFSNWDIKFPSTMPSNNLTFTARYDINQYTLEFVNYDGTIIQTGDYDYGLTLRISGLPLFLTQEGYTFTGWNTRIPTTMPSHDVTITATYDINQYTLEYVDSDGTVLQTEDFDYNTDLSEVVAPIDPSQDGDVFTGWDLEFPSTMPSHNVTITATYESNQYTLEYLDYDEAIILTEEFDYNTDLSGFLVPSNPSRVGYTFIGWDLENPSTMPAHNVIITAIYEINQYTLEYVDYDGTVLQTEDFDYNTDLSGIVAPNNPSHLGRIFTGWNLDFPSIMPSNDISITATYITERMITGTGTNAYADFGNEVIIVEDYIIVCADGYDGGRGAVFIYKFSNPLYERIITGTGTVENDRFGIQVAVKGDILIVSATNYNDYQGAIFMYKFSDASYEQLITGTGMVSGDYFGKSITIDGDNIIVRASGYNNNQGAIYLFKFSDPSYERMITGSLLDSDDLFGVQIAIEGDYIIVGAPGYNNQKGATYLYKFSDPLYERMITGAYTDSYEHFGEEIVIEGDYIIVSVQDYNDEQGAVYLYKFSVPLYERMITGTGTNTDDLFGYQTVIEGDIILISAPFSNGGKGAIYLYKFSDSSFESIITAPESDYNGFFGSLLSIEGDKIIIGALGYNDSQGAVYLYDFSDFSYLRTIIGTGTVSEDSFGRSITIEEDNIVVSAPHYNDDQGAIYLYKFSDSSYEQMITGAFTASLDLFGETVVTEENYIIVRASQYGNLQGAIFVYEINIQE